MHNVHLLYGHFELIRGGKQLRLCKTLVVDGFVSTLNKFEDLTYSVNCRCPQTESTLEQVRPRHD